MVLIHNLYEGGVKKMNFKLAMLLILASLAVIFITQNVAVVEVSFLFWSISMSRALLIFFLLVIGFTLGWFLHSYLSYRKSKDESANDT
jgi:uncharacterized integral membrane protein